MDSVANLLFQRITAYGQLAAISYNGRSITYAELSGKALSVAGALIECGAERKTIGIVGQRTPSSYFGILGILFAQAIVLATALSKSTRENSFGGQSSRQTIISTPKSN